MGTPSPELKQLWIRVLKRVHPDLAIDEQDRIRCERLTKLANEAYQAGNIEALRAVLRPSQPSIAEALRAYSASRQRQQAPPPPPAGPSVQQGSTAPNITPKRSFKSWFGLSNVPPWTALSFKQLPPVAIAVVILIWIGFSLYSIRTTQHAVTNNAATRQPRPSKSYGDVIPNRISQNSNPSTVVDTTVGTSREGSPTKVSLFTTSGHPSLDPSFLNAVRPPVASSGEPSHLYIEQMRERLSQSFSNYEHVDATVPPGNSAEMWFDVNRDGSLSNVRVGKPSGWDSLDYACMRAVERTETVGALPEDYKLRTLPATFACTYTGSNGLLTSRSVDSAADRPELYVGSVRNTAHE
jgi:hypothetical protein